MVEQLELDLGVVQHFITIRVDEEGEVELDCGDIPLHESIGLLTVCLNELMDRDPGITVRYSGKSFDSGFDDYEGEEE
jgi:hypothetical protein